MLFHTCQSCGVRFTKPNNPNRPYQFCSNACTGKSLRTEKIKADCAICGNPYDVWPYQIRNGRKACSKKCGDKARDFGKTSEARRVRASKAYREWREAVFNRDGYKCQCCGVIGGKLNADHIKRFSDHPELRLSIENGRTLCVRCHLNTATFGNRKSR